MLLLSRSSCCVSHSCSRLPDLTRIGPFRGLGSQGSQLTPGPAEAGHVGCPCILAS